MRTIEIGGLDMKEKEGRMITVDAVEVGVRTTVCRSVSTSPRLLLWHGVAWTYFYFSRSRQKTSEVNISVGP